jgi:hypothetical protein
MDWTRRFPGHLCDMVGMNAVAGPDVVDRPEWMSSCEQQWLGGTSISKLDSEPQASPMLVPLSVTLNVGLVCHGVVSASSTRLGDCPT